jgi:hypothetical protein
LPRLSAQIARAPVHLAKAVEDGAADAEFRIRGKLHVLFGIELVERIDQAHDAGVDQVLERNMLGKVLVNPPCDVLHLRHLIKYHFLEFFGCAFVLGSVDVCGIHDVISNSQVPPVRECLWGHLARDSAATGYGAAGVTKKEGPSGGLFYSARAVVCSCAQGGGAVLFAPHGTERIGEVYPVLAWPRPGLSVALVLQL